MTRVIAITNHKGGVAKTTTSANLGAGLALRGKRVLLIDLDPQRNLTDSLTSEESETTLYDSMTGDAPLPVLSVGENLDLCPSDVYLAKAESDLSTKIGKETILKRLLAPVLDRYDYILLDCPPSLGLLTINALASATDLYLTLTAEALPLRGLDMLSEIVSDIRKTINPSLDFSGVIITRYQSRRLNKEVVENISARYGERLFKTRIRENISIAESPLSRSSIFDYDPKSRGAQDYLSLADEVIEREKKVVNNSQSKL